MKSENFKHEVLQFLYQGYLDCPTCLFDITPIIDKYDYSMDLIFNELKASGWVRNLTNNGIHLMAQITLQGINAVDRNYLKTYTDKAVEFIGDNGGRGSLMQAFEITEGKDFQRVHDLAKYFEYHTFFSNPLFLFNDVQIGLSSAGQDYYETNNPRFEG